MFSMQWILIHFLLVKAVISRIKVPIGEKKISFIFIECELRNMNKIAKKVETLYVDFIMIISVVYSM